MDYVTEWHETVGHKISIKCLELTSWGGTSKEIVLRSTLMKLSIHGMMKNIPANKQKENKLIYLLLDASTYKSSVQHFDNFLH